MWLKTRIKLIIAVDQSTTPEQCVLYNVCWFTYTYDEPHDWGNTHGTNTSTGLPGSSLFLNTYQHSLTTSLSLQLLTYACTHTRSHTHMLAHTHICMHMHMHTHTHSCFLKFQDMKRKVHASSAVHFGTVVWFGSFCCGLPSSAASGYFWTHHHNTESSTLREIHPILFSSQTQCSKSLLFCA